MYTLTLTLKTKDLFRKCLWSRDILYAKVGHFLGPNMGWLCIRGYTLTRRLSEALSDIHVIKCDDGWKDLRGAEFDSSLRKFNPRLRKMRTHENQSTQWSLEEKVAVIPR